MLLPLSCFGAFIGSSQNIKIVKKKLDKNGIIIIEVPHARDALFTLFDCENLNNFLSGANI